MTLPILETGKPRPRATCDSNSHFLFLAILTCWVLCAVLAHFKEVQKVRPGRWLDNHLVNVASLFPSETLDLLYLAHSGVGATGTQE